METRFYPFFSVRTLARPRITVFILPAVIFPSNSTCSISSQLPNSCSTYNLCCSLFCAVFPTSDSACFILVHQKTLLFSKFHPVSPTLPPSSDIYFLIPIFDSLEFTILEHWIFCVLITTFILLFPFSCYHRNTFCSPSSSPCLASKCTVSLLQVVHCKHKIMAGQVKSCTLSF